MSKHQTREKRRIYLLLSLFGNLGLLFFYKYFNFIAEALNNTLLFLPFELKIPFHNLLLPVGISFYTFQTLAYTIDVYRGKIAAERHLGYFALYVSYFPQLVAGPIERSESLLPQLHQHFFFDRKRTSYGLKLMIWGFFKKIVIADNLAIMVEQVYSTPNAYSAIFFIIATVFFAYQIYCDFSGYSDIAKGAALIMGIELMDNFHSPYGATSIGDFWGKWHISLSTWFRDYLYIPLGGNRVNEVRHLFNIFIVFLVSGIWHGANWTFFVWGLYHGACIITSHLISAIGNKITLLPKNMQSHPIYKIWQMFLTFILVCIGWVFFRANTISDAFYILKSVFLNNSLSHTPFTTIWAQLPLPTYILSPLCVIIIVLHIIHMRAKSDNIVEILHGRPAWIRWPVYYMIMFFILFLGQYDQANFIYFQF
ncbi:MAG TPA: MBOAT family O-acyltransferase [Elusimicrobiota bacterium]|nr:MBOAT family O-acyltransferase [Elusimicrobiota bacterium]